MKIINYILSFGMLGLWIYSLIANLGILVNIGIGILIPIMFLFDDLLYKPIDLIGWKVVETQKQEEAER